MRKVFTKDKSVNQFKIVNINVRWFGWIKCFVLDLTKKEDNSLCILKLRVKADIKIPAATDNLEGLKLVELLGTFLINKLNLIKIQQTAGFCVPNLNRGKNMWGKILTGVVIGVGAVAAAPFTGGGSLLGAASIASSLAGAGTIAAATGAGVTGAVVGGVMADIGDDERENIKNEGRAEGKAEVREEMVALEKKLILAFKKLKSHDKHFQAIIALEAVGVACAACDGDFSENEKEEIGEFVHGMMSQSIPEGVKERIQKIYDTPPSVKEAFKLAKDSGVSLDIYESLIQFVMDIDGVKEQERVFVQAWSQLKVA